MPLYSPKKLAQFATARRASKDSVSLTAILLQLNSRAFNEFIFFKSRACKMTSDVRERRRAWPAASQHC